MERKRALVFLTGWLAPLSHHDEEKAGGQKGAAKPRFKDFTRRVLAVGGAFSFPTSPARQLVFCRDTQNAVLWTHLHFYWELEELVDV